MQQNKYNMFFGARRDQRPFIEALKEVQEYMSSNFSSLISQNTDEQKKQILAYISKYLSDKTLKSTLTPIISKLSDMRIVSAELDYLLYEPVKEFITMAVLLVGNIPLLYFLNRSWFDTLMYTPIGKGILALSAFAIFISLAAVIRLTRPVEYKR